MTRFRFVAVTPIEVVAEVTGILVRFVVFVLRVIAVTPS